MKFRLIISFVAVIAVFQLASCDNGSDSPSVTEVERVRNLLIGTGTAGSTWTLNTATVDDIDYSEVFAGFTITFNETGFTSTNGSLVFASTESWSFKDETAKEIVTGSQLEITIDELTQNRLVFSFNWDETIYGRVEAVGGRNVFTLTR